MIWREIEDQGAVLEQTARMMASIPPRPDWNAAWQEHLNLLECNDDAQKPAYVGRSSIHRFNGRYIQALVPDFEERWRERFREWLFRTFLSDVSGLSEFGAGSADHLVAFRKQFPGKEAVAFDYSEAAVDIAQRKGIWSAWFDLYEPDFGRGLERDSAVLTFDALEQVGERFWPFLGYLLDKKPKRVVHVEPLYELYDHYCPFDSIAVKYHEGRGYLRGFLPALEALHGEAINVLYCQRMGFGSRFHDGYSVVCWEPI